MKTKNKSHAWLLSVALAVMAVIALPANSSAQEKGSAKGGAQQLMKPMTVGDINKLEPGDAVVMSCPKCKTITVTYIDKTTKGAIKEGKATPKHLCDGCENIIKTEGLGKQAKDVVAHVCKTCGSEDAFCCVMKKGSAPTKGMENR